MKKIFLFGLVLIFGIISCDKDEDINRFFWNQTKCADPWNTGENDSNEQTKIAVINFLENEQVTILDVNFDNKSPLDNLCESCGCGTGQRIIVDVEVKDSEAMANLTFYQ